MKNEKTISLLWGVALAFAMAALALMFFSCVDGCVDKIPSHPLGG